MENTSKALFATVSLAETLDNINSSELTENCRLSLNLKNDMLGLK